MRIQLLFELTPDLEWPTRRVSITWHVNSSWRPCHMNVNMVRFEENNYVMFVMGNRTMTRFISTNLFFIGQGKWDKSRNLNTKCQEGCNKKRETLPNKLFSKNNASADDKIIKQVTSLTLDFLKKKKRIPTNLISMFHRIDSCYLPLTFPFLYDIVIYICTSVFVNIYMLVLLQLWAGLQLCT